MSDTQSIAFTSIPSNFRLHGTYAEIDPQNQAGSQNQRTLIIGQILPAAATANPGLVGVPQLGSGLAAAQVMFGPQSQIALMYGQYLGQDVIGETWLLGVADDPAAVGATGTVLIANTPTANGVLSLYVGGIVVPVPCLAGATATSIATALAAAINALPTMPVTATATAGSVALSADNHGTCGNEIDLRLNYLGAAAGEAVPAGLAVTITPMASGAQNPTTGVTAGLGNLGTKTFDFIVNPYTDAATLTSLANFLNLTTGRWSFTQQLYGFVFSAMRGTAAALTTFGLTRNDFTLSVLGFYDSPSPAWLWAADYAGACAVSLRADPALPLQELALNVLAPPVQSRFPISIKNGLTFDGISVFDVVAGQVIINRAITLYQLNAAGSPDTTWLKVETPFSLVFLLRDMVAFLKATYGRKKLAPDGTNIAGGSNMVTAASILSSVLARYQQYCNLGQAVNYAAFKAGAAAVNAGGGRVNVLLPFILPDQLIMLALKVNFIAGG